jgi:hypothetical protein
MQEGGSLFVFLLSFSWAGGPQDFPTQLCSSPELHWLPGARSQELLGLHHPCQMFKSLSLCL